MTTQQNMLEQRMTRHELTEEVCRATMDSVRMPRRRPTDDKVGATDTTRRSETQEAQGDARRRHLHEAQESGVPPRNEPSATTHRSNYTFFVEDSSANASARSNVATMAKSGG